MNLGAKGPILKGLGKYPLPSRPQALTQGPLLAEAWVTGAAPATPLLLLTKAAAWGPHACTMVPACPWHPYSPAGGWKPPAVPHWYDG